MSFIDDLRELADRLEAHEKKGLEGSDLSVRTDRIATALRELREDACRVMDFANQGLGVVLKVKTMEDAMESDRWMSNNLKDLRNNLHHIRLVAVANRRQE